METFTASSRHKLPKDHPLQTLNVPAVLAKIDRIRELSGSRVVFLDDRFSFELRPHPPACMPNRRTVIIRQQRRDVEHLPIESAGRSYGDSRLVSELVATGLSCGAAVIALVVVFGRRAAAPVSGGTSLFVSVLAKTAAAASTVQCIAGAVRVASTVSGDGFVEWLDTQDWYAQTMTALDVISATTSPCATKLAT